MIGLIWISLDVIWIIATGLTPALLTACTSPVVTFFVVLEVNLAPVLTAGRSNYRGISPHAWLTPMPGRTFERQATRLTGQGTGHDWLLHAPHSMSWPQCDILLQAHPYIGPCSIAKKYARLHSSSVGKKRAWRPPWWSSGDIVVSAHTVSDTPCTTRWCCIYTWLHCVNVCPLQTAHAVVPIIMCNVACDEGLKQSRTRIAFDSL